MKDEKLPLNSSPDASAAHEFLCELRTRISTQPLPYQYGVEARALESLWEIFGQARTTMKKYPGCKEFADAVTRMLNMELRPVTAKWHRAFEEGRLNSKDGADEFRGELATVQQKLRDFAAELHLMAYGTKKQDDLTPPALTKQEIDKCFAPLPFGIPPTCELSEKITDEINQSESEEIRQRRAVYNIKTPDGSDAIGLGFSGGGIRSATFCLGVTQVLAAHGLFKDVDFLSTVSGGGYTGSALTARLGTDTNVDDFANPHGPDPLPIAYIRHHAKFLNPLNLKDAWAMFTATMAGMLLNWSAPMLLIVLTALSVILLETQVSYWPWSILFIVTGMLTGIALIIYGGLLRGRPKWSQGGGAFLAGSCALLLFITIGWLVNSGYGLFDRMIEDSLTTAGSVGVVSVIVASGPALIWFFPLLQKPVIRKIALQVLLWVMRFVIPLLALILFYVCRHIGEMPSNPAASSWELNHYGGVNILACFATILAGVALLLLNINLTAPHRLYRDRLAKTFIQTLNTNDAPVELAKVNKSQKAPYHLINTALNLPSSDNPALRDRKCDFFLFSQYWCGAPTTGYYRTGDWKPNGKSVDLATAMAISGAAASSYMGLGSMPTLTALLTFLNVRMGFWIRRPSNDSLFKRPGFLCLMREMFGIGMSEKAAWLNLSDGGHIENMAVYELLRRRCKFIICVDGEADPTFTFGGLMTLVRHAQIDFGIRIKPKVSELRPDLQTGWSQIHALLSRIYYPETEKHPAATGLLLYLKLSVTGNESELIKRYRALHPAFPHETTADQFFNEEQFEAYRQLGVHIAEGLFSPALVNTLEVPPTVADWFRRLANNLLEPENR